MLPFRTSFPGPATKPRDRTQELLLVWGIAEYKDIVEEALDLFRGDVFFANFEIDGPADRLFVVLILYISRVNDALDLSHIVLEGYGAL